jgi:hypothetical protein
MYGTFRWEGDEFADQWVGQGVDASVAVSAGWYGEASTYILIDGTVGDLEGAANAAEFADVYRFDAAIGSSCPGEPSGSIAVRDSEGEWYTVDFDGPAFSGGTIFPADCDGCGDIWYRGVKVGQACPDFTQLSDWGVEGPWD